jgi:hypothetical protein
MLSIASPMMGVFRKVSETDKGKDSELSMLYDPLEYYLLYTDQQKCYNSIYWW